MDPAFLFGNNIIATHEVPKTVIEDMYLKFTLEFLTNIYEMLQTKLAFSETDHPQADGLAEWMIQTMEDISRTFCEYGIEHKDHEVYTYDWVTLLPEIQLCYNTRMQSNTGKSPSLVERGWNPFLPVDHLKNNILNINPTAKDFHDF
ncbi:hypothetical protein O181_060006 [Austropuccinia psidii MF-1]|uniref:Integrase catalytic domain-containing protein n=1 Tax=Austropuccinia psidii MF-1 TaxID=1389203 RepID=A0A9Q3EDA4_9BASI|nr:hypothetical protein [Austropuccinia psidii MF-1]